MTSMLRKHIRNLTRATLSLRRGSGSPAEGTRTRWEGTCAVCGNVQRLTGSQGVLADHGYKNPKGWGQHMGGSCGGARKKPFELSSEGAQHFLDQCRTWLEQAKKNRTDPTYRKSWEKSTKSWPRVLAELDSSIRAYEYEIDRMKARIASWRPGKSVKEFDEHTREREEAGAKDLRAKERASKKAEKEAKATALTQKREELEAKKTASAFEIASEWEALEKRPDRESTAYQAALRKLANRTWKEIAGWGYIRGAKERLDASLTRLGIVTPLPDGRVSDYTGIVRASENPKLLAQLERWRN